MTYRIFRLLFVFGLFTACSSPTSAPAPGNAATEDAAATEAAETVYQDLSPEEFADHIGAPNTVLLDVRTPAETAGGVIDGAIELDYRSAGFAAEIAALDKDKIYLVYCASGGRSGKACGMLKDAGFGEVYNLAGGYRAWTN